MTFETDSTDDAVKRLRKVEGQIGGIIRMLEEQRDRTDVLAQLDAAARALARTSSKLRGSD